ncbi:hypothetical protein E2320_012115, partial [Naja naja]
KKSVTSPKHRKRPKTSQLALFLIRTAGMSKSHGQPSSKAAEEPCEIGSQLLFCAQLVLG